MSDTALAWLQVRKDVTHANDNNRIYAFKDLREGLNMNPFPQARQSITSEVQGSSYGLNLGSGKG